MPFIPVPNVALVEIRYLWDTQRVENTLSFEFDHDPDEADLNALGEFVLSGWSSGMMPLLSGNLSLTEVYLTSLTTDTSPTFTVTPIAPVDGGVASESVPSNVAACVSFRTSGRGRSSRGRNYLPGIPNSLVDLNTLNATLQINILSVYSDLQEGATSNNYPWVVVSRFHNGAPRVEGITARVVNTVFTDNVVDSQRRRLPGRGR